MRRVRAAAAVVLLSATGIAAIVAGVWWLGLRPDLLLFTVIDRLRAPVGLGVLIALGALALALGPRACAAFLLVAALGALLALTRRVGYPSTVSWASFACLTDGLEVGIAPLLVGLLVLRRRGSATVREGAVIGALAGLSALGALDMHCVMRGVPHNLLAHGGAAAVLVACGALGARLSEGRGGSARAS